MFLRTTKNNEKNNFFFNKNSNLNFLKNNRNNDLKESINSFETHFEPEDWINEKKFNAVIKEPKNQIFKVSKLL